MSDLIEPALRELVRRLMGQIDDRMVSLAEGTVGDYAAYTKAVGYLAAMNDVVGVCQQMDKDLHGRVGTADAET